MSANDEIGLFAGGHRARMYDDPVESPPKASRNESTAEPQPASPPPPPPSPQPPASQPLAPGSGVEALMGELAPLQPVEEAPASPGAWERLLIKVGAKQAPPTQAELEDVENERIVRQSTWTRAMSAVVVNPKGGSMKTPLTLLLSGAIAEIRGGGVAAWEATEVPADLAAIAEGRPPRGLGELLAARDMVQSAGTLAGYTAPQTSHAAVIGSVSNREELSPADVWAVRALLGTYYQVEIADTGNNLQRPATETLLEGADAIVIPCVVNHKSARGLERALRAAERIPSLRGRAILVVSHDGGPEDAEFAQTLTAQLAHHFRTKAIVEIPFDPAIRADGELTYSALQPATRLAIRRVARHVIECFNNAPFNESE